MGSMQDRTGQPVIRIVIRKSAKVLQLWHDSSLLGSFPIALGSHPAGPKRQCGDGRTPEGLYQACVRNAESKYYRSIGLNYPNRWDAECGLAAGLIDQAEHDRIVSAEASGSRPPWNTALGGEIMIHGGGVQSDWTAGCIALDDRDMNMVWDHAPLGTEILVLP